MYIVWKWEARNPYGKGGETMANGFGYGGNGNIFDLLQDRIGETVTIYTTSGGDSGSGFTGVILAVNPCFVRLVTHIGPAADTVRAMAAVTVEVMEPATVL